MSKLVLIRHAPVVVDPGRSSDTWTLDPRGYAEVARLRDEPDVAAVSRFVTSPEPKTAPLISL